MSRAPQVAFNPLTWCLRPDGVFDATQAPPLPEIYRQIRDAGFDAVHVEPPEDMALADYRRLLDDTGLAPAPGYFQAAFADLDDLGATREQARRVAGRHAALGLDRIFIAEQFGAPPRVEAPAVGAGFDQERLDRVIDGLGVVAADMSAEGVTPCLHPHVGTWIETERELDAVLAGIDPAVLLFGPDTGHLVWAAMDPAAVIERHRDRVGAVHLKDLHSARRVEARADGCDYGRTVAAHLWTEPGRGDVDFAAVLQALAGFDGWYIVEVDLPDQPSAQDSARVSAAWVSERLHARNQAVT